MTDPLPPRLVLSPGPHLRAEMTTQQIMWWVSGALAPVYLWAVAIYGLRVIVLLVSGIGGAVAGEWLVNRLRSQAQTLSDGSAVLTGLLLVGTISPGLPAWMPAVGGFLGLVCAKMLFGGLGYNIFNPALVGRAIMMATFPVAMTTTWLTPRLGAFMGTDAVTQASPLGIMKLEGLAKATEILGMGPEYYWHLLVGLRVGSVGEVSVVLMLLGAGVLLWKRIIKWYIPLSVLAGLLLIALCSGIPLFHLLTGGLWFGAFFMATDYVTAPMMPKGQIIFGLGIGVLTGVIRIWGGYPEGICYAILMVNAVTPALNHWFRPRRPHWEGAPS
ncbi:MAG: RnfABCDGE type electron transport complex subunit D [Deltaproteobacteria bacterium]|nr:RnfABCDGE type electron transport complex subunit D [Deltaproteobacteria bacterium]